MIIGTSPGIDFLTSESTGDLNDHGWEVGAGEVVDGFYIGDLLGAGFIDPIFTIEDGAPAFALNLDSTGKVGIGNSIPLESLHVFAPPGDNAGLRLEDDTGDYWTLGVNGATSAFTNNSGAIALGVENGLAGAFPAISGHHSCSPTAR